MVRKTPLTDNLDWTAVSKLEGLSDKSIDDLRKIADLRLSKENENLLVFPHSFGDHCDDLGDNAIFSLSGNEIKTGNIMGFVGINNTQVSIKSRFAQSDGNDYFLHYMLAKVFRINLVNLMHGISNENIFDFLIYLFPYFLGKALSQGLFKKYQRFEHNDANIKGPIDIARHIQRNIPFRGTVAYNTREHSYDNDVTQLIRHTIEYIRTKETGQLVLQNDSDTQSNVSQIVFATPTYSQNQRQQIINKNLRPLNHPYFTEYTDLQKLCLQILRQDELKFGEEKDKVYGVLFDGAWLWEEYLFTILEEKGFSHPQNKIGAGAIRMFEKGEQFDNNSRKLYPDFYKKKDDKYDYILDAKYKHLNGGVGREDLYQVVTYMYCTEAKQGGFVYPSIDDKNCSTPEYQLCGYKGTIKVIPVYIPQEANDWNDFRNKMEESEKILRFEK